MNRRKFLRNAGLGAGLAVGPAWLWKAFGQEATAGGATPGAGGPDRKRAVAVAWSTAVANGKPLLVLVVPEDEKAKWTRGELFGELLNHGGPEVLADLALCDVACATVRETRDALRLEAADADPLALLVEERNGLPSARPVSVDAAALVVDRESPYREPGKGSWEDRVRAEERAIRVRLARVSEALHAAIAPNAAAIRPLADRARSRLGEADAARIESIVAENAAVDSELVYRGAAILRRAAEERPDLRGRLISVLAAATRRRIVALPPAGARWANSGGCGVTVEEAGETGIAVGCGMAHVAELSQRFLYFFADAN